MLAPGQQAVPGFEMQSGSTGVDSCSMLKRVHALLQTWQEAAAEQKGVDSSLLHDQQVLALAQQLRQEVAQQAAKNHKKGEALLHLLRTCFTCFTCYTCVLLHLLHLLYLRPAAPAGTGCCCAISWAHCSRCLCAQCTTHLVSMPSCTVLCCGWKACKTARRMAD